MDLETRLDKALAEGDRIDAARIPTPAPSPKIFEQRADALIGELRRHERVEIPPKSPDSFGFDAALSADPGVKFLSKLEDWRAVRDAWLAQITSEDLVDVQAIYYRSLTRSSVGWYLRPTDGAFVRRQNPDALAYTPRAWAQLVTLLMQEIPDKPRSPVEAYRWLAPAVREIVFEHLRNRSRRTEKESAPILLRTFISAQGVRALRAVVSGRHSGRHFDDEALARVLDEVLPVGSKAYVSRAIDRTIGHAVIADLDTAKAVVSWSNSETGAASLGFGGACWISALETLIRSNVEEATDQTLEPSTKPVTIATAHGSSRRAHTLPRVGVSHADRAIIARERMKASIGKASTAARQLASDWTLALQSFPAGTELAMPTDRSLIAEIVLDRIEDRTRLKADDREALKAVILSSDRLAQLPYLSAAHLAGAWALLGAAQTDPDEAARCQLEAGRWVKERF